MITLFGCGQPFLGSSGPAEPSVLVEDTFTGITLADINGRTPETTTGGATWTKVLGNYDAGTNRSNVTEVAIGPPGVYMAVYVVDAGVSDCTISCRLVSTAPAFYGVVFRYVDSQNFWIAGHYHTAGKLQIYEVTANVLTERASTGIEATLDDYDKVITLVLSGNDMTATINGITLNHSSSVRNTATKHGPYFSAVVGYFDDFQIVG